MPVQDNEDTRKTSEPVADAEEELRKQQAVKQEHQQDETSVQKSGKLLPFLNAKAERHQSRIDTIDGKIATNQDKIAKHQAAIDRLSDKADRLEDKNRMLEATLGNIPLVRKFIESNERKIADIRDNKIPNRTQKLVNCEDKIGQLSAKRDRIEHKFNRVIALNDAIKSFSIGFNKERREAFADAMNRLGKANEECLTDKRDALVSQKNNLMAEYNRPDTSMSDKFNIQNKINALSKRITQLDMKITELTRSSHYFSERTNDELDAAMKLTSDKLGEMVDNGTVSTPELSEQTITAAHKVETLDKSQVAALADQLGIQPLANAEMQMEDDYNMIDGIINNGSKSDKDNAKAELTEAIRNMESLADNPFVSDEVRASAAEELVKMKKQLEMLDVSDEAKADNWLSAMVEKGDAVLTDDGGFRINSDYYKELPRNESHFETMTEAQAAEVMSALTMAGVAYSAATKGEDNVSLVVSKNDVSVLNDVMYSAIGKIAHTEAVKENAEKGGKNGRCQTVNPEYYASLSYKQRFTRFEPRKTAHSIATELVKQKIPYSAVVCKNGEVALTVSQDNSEAYKQIEKAVKGERAVEFVNADSSKALPEQERVNQQTEKVQARKKSAVPKKDSGKAFISRSMMRKEAQRVKHQKSSPEKPQTRKRDNQGLE